MYKCWSNSININPHILKQAGCMQPTTCIFQKQREESFHVKELHWNPGLYLLPCQQCSKIKIKKEQKIQSMCITVAFPVAEGLIKSSDVSLHLGRNVYEGIYYQKWP